MAHTNEEILLSSVCDRVMAFCNKLNKRLDKLDEQQHAHHQCELTQPVQPFHPYLPAQPHSFHSADQPWQQTYQFGVPSWEEPTLHSQPPCPNTQPWRQPPDPPDWQRNTQLQPYGSHDFGATDLVAHGHTVAAVFSAETYTIPVTVAPPCTSLTDQQIHLNEYTQPHTSCNRVDWYNRSALIHGQPNHNPNFGGFPPHPPSGLPSCGSPTAADVCQPPQLRSPYSWVDMPPHHIQYSGPAYAASTIVPTTTTQGRSCQEYPVDVQQLLLRPTSPYCSKLTPLAVTPVLIPPPPLSPGSSTAQLLAAAPPPPSAAIFLPCSPDRIRTLSIIPAAAAPSQVHECDGVNIHYKGMQTDGTIFKPTFEQGDPIDIELGRGQVMKRWLLVLGMCLGEKRKLKITSKLNYGEHVFDPGGFLVVASWFPP